MSDGIKVFMAETSGKNQRNQKQFKIFGSIDLYIKDPLPDHVNILEVLDQVEEKIPWHLARGIDIFYVGSFKEFEEKQVNAMYRDGAVYVSNHQDDVPDMVDDIIHEIAHAVEHIYAEYIYSDSKIQNEFLGKRERLRDLISEYGYLDKKEVPFLSLEYSKKLDNYLYKELGYDKLQTFCAGLFIRPYSVTDIREYFASAFEEYLMGDKAYLSRISPTAHMKIQLLCMDEV